MREKIVLIDGYSILSRAFYGIHASMTNFEGLHTNAIYGFLNIMFKIMDEEAPDYLAVAFDVKAPTFRHRLYDAYKGTRKGMPEELTEQVPVLKELLTAMGIRTAELFRLRGRRHPRHPFLKVRERGPFCGAGLRRQGHAPAGGKERKDPHPQNKRGLCGGGGLSGGRRGGAAGGHSG